MSNLKAGRVSRIRVNPKDCQSTLDVMKAAQIDTRSMSFDQQVSLAFSSLLESARKSGLLPEPDPFEYLNRMQPYLGRQRNSQKARLTEQISELGPRLRSPVIYESERPEVIPVPAAAVRSDASAEDLEVVRSATNRLTELLAKRDASEDNPNISWGSSDEEELKRCMQIVYPEG